MTIENLLTRPPHLPLVAPSILSADFAHLADDAKASLDAGADLLHLDVMDGHFVPNLTMGPALCASLRTAMPHAFFDVHLMVTDPGIYIEPFAKAGADHVTFHVEIDDDPIALADRVRAAGMSAGLSINPPTPVERVMPYVEAMDMILVMSVNPGYSGQSFIADVLRKTEAISSRLRADQRLQMDGGVNAKSVAACRDAGCDVLVAASAIFGTDDYARAIDMLRGTAVPAGGTS